MSKPSNGPSGERFAMFCESLEGPDGLRYEAVPRQRLGSGSVRLEICACGVNFPDLLMTRGKYQWRPDPPFIPGMEASGVVTEASPDVDGFSEGDRVTVTARSGLFTTEAVVPAAGVRHAPVLFTMSESAAFLIAAHTARHALVDRGQVRSGETVLVFGAGGGVGLAAVQLATLLGARVLAAAGSEDKMQAARLCGAEQSINYDSPDFIDRVRAFAPDGVDVVFDPVGGALFERSQRLMAWNGRLLVIGFASGNVGLTRSNLPLIRGFSIVGVRAGEAMRRNPDLARRSAREIAEWTSQGHLRPLVSRTYPLKDAASALQALERRSVVGRAVLIAAENRKS